MAAVDTVFEQLGSDDRARAGRAEEEDRGRVGHHGRRSGRGRRRRAARRRRRRAAEEKTAFDVVLTGAGQQKIQVIKVVRAITGLGLKEAKDLVDGAPRPSRRASNQEEADYDQGAARRGRRLRRGQVVSSRRGQAVSRPVRHRDSALSWHASLPRGRPACVDRDDVVRARAVLLFCGYIGRSGPRVRLRSRGCLRYPEGSRRRSARFACMPFFSASPSLIVAKGGCSTWPRGHCASRAQDFLSSQARSRPPQPDRHPA